MDEKNLAILRKLKELARQRGKNDNLAQDLVDAKNNLEPQKKQILIKKLFKVYAYKVLDKLFKNLEKIQNDNSLNTIYSKIINSEKMIDISKNNLKRIKSNEKKFEILDFILKTQIPITMYIYRNKEK